MASLQDQLLKAGLVDEKKAKQASKQKRKQAKAKRKGQVIPGDNRQAQLQQQAKQQAERDRELNLKRKAEAEEKAVQAQIDQLIEQNQVQLSEGEIEYSFTDGTQIKRLLVNATIRDQLSSGKLAIVKAKQGYQVIPRPAAEKIKQRDESRVLLLVEKTKQQDEDDPYADYQVPDDLMW